MEKTQETIVCKISFTKIPSLENSQDNEIIIILNNFLQKEKNQEKAKEINNNVEKNYIREHCGPLH